MRLLAICIGQRQSFKIAEKKYCYILYTERDFETENFTGSGLEGTPKLLKVFYVKTMRHSRFKFGQFFVH